MFNFLKKNADNQKNKEDCENAFPSEKEIVKHLPVKEPHHLTSTEILNKIYEESSTGHRSAIFTNSCLSKQMLRQIKNLGFYVIIDKDFNQQPQVIIYW